MSEVELLQQIVDKLQVISTLIGILVGMVFFIGVFK